MCVKGCRAVTMINWKSQEVNGEAETWYFLSALLLIVVANTAYGGSAAKILPCIHNTTSYIVYI